MEYISKSEKETSEIANEFALKAQPGDVFALKGDLGSGKTTFVKAFAKALGIKDEITSPTFIMMKKYKVPSNKKGIKNLIHIDCYRMGSVSDAYSIGIPELIEGKDSIMILEWPGKIKEILPRKTLTLNFGYIDNSTRRISLNEGCEE